MMAPIVSGQLDPGGGHMGGYAMYAYMAYAQAPLREKTPTPFSGCDIQQSREFTVSAREVTVLVSP